MIANPDVALTVCALGVIGIYAGLCGRILIGVTGGVIATIALASLLDGWAILRIHGWVAIAVSLPLAVVTLSLLKVVWKARKNKAV
jgi:hypothetical protein